VDIAAQDGISGSQTVYLFKHGWEGMAVECDPKMFSALSDLYRKIDKISLFRTTVNPHNILALLAGAGCP